jgi:integrase
MGYYSDDTQERPFVRVKTILHRNDPILTCAPSTNRLTRRAGAGPRWFAIVRLGLQVIPIPSQFPLVSGPFPSDYGSSRFAGQDGDKAGDKITSRLKPEIFMLTAKKVERATKRGRYPCGLVKGLLLQIAKGGAKSWVLRYELNGRERWMGLGSAAVFTLKQARERALEARRLLADDIDPLATKQANKQSAKLAAARRLTFAEAAQQYFDQHESKWRNASHRDQFLSTLKAHVYPVLANMDVASIDTRDVLRALEPIWKTKSVTADRTRSRIEQVIDWAIVRGHRPPGTNPARWKGHLDQVLPAARQLAPIVHHKAMHYRDVPAFMAALRAHDTVPARALEFLITVICRSNEVLGARWSEITDKVWTVPAERTKTRRPHRVPLAPAAIELLRKLPRDGGEFVFIGKRPGAPMHRMALTWLMQLTGQAGKSTTHGFRSSFRDWAGETTAFPHDVCEAALAHVRGDQSVQAYARGDLFNKRRKLMEAWAKYCTSLPSKVSGAVVSLRGGR